MEFVTTEIFSYDIFDQILEGQKFKINKFAKPTILPRSPKISKFQNYDSFLRQPTSVVVDLYNSSLLAPCSKFINDSFAFNKGNDIKSVIMAISCLSVLNEGHHWRATMISVLVSAC